MEEFDVISEKLVHCIFILWVNSQNLSGRKRWVLMETLIPLNLQKSVDICGYELPRNLQNITQKDLTEVKIFQKVLVGLLFSETPYM